MSRDEFRKALREDIDPALLAGEGWSATDEVPRAKDIKDPWMRERVKREGEFYPGVKRKKK